MLYSHSAASAERPYYLLVLDNLWRASVLALAYDVSMLGPWLGSKTTHLDSGEAAPALTTEFSSLVYFQLAGLLAVVNELPALFGELHKLETRKAKLETPAPLATPTAADEPLLKSSAVTVVDDQKAEDDLPTINRQITLLKAEMERIPKNAAFFGILMCMIAISTMLATKPMLNGFNQNQNISAATNEFFISFAPFFIAFPFRLLSEFVMLSSGKQTAAMGLALTSLGVTLLLQGFLVSSLSMLGWSTGINFLATALFFSLYVARSYEGMAFFKSMGTWIASDKEQILGYMIKALPNLVTMASDIFIPFITSMIAGSLPGAVKIWNAPAQLLNINAWLIAAVSQAAGIIVGNEKGKANDSFHLVKRAVYAGLVATFLFQLPLTVSATSRPSFFSENVVGSASADTPSWDLMGMTSLYGLIDGQRTTVLQITRNLVSSSWYSTGVSTLGLATGLILANYLCKYTALGLLGIPTGLAIGTAVATAFLYKQLPKNIETAESAASPTTPNASGVPRSHSSIAREAQSGRSVGSWCCTFASRTPQPALVSTPVNNQALTPTSRWRSLC
ncbi:hypothetical protein BH10PSE19_BH10PSE19_11310 [soil metagenome]